MKEPFEAVQSLDILLEEFLIALPGTETESVHGTLEHIAGLADECVEFAVV